MNVISFVLMSVLPAQNVFCNIVFDEASVKLSSVDTFNPAVRYDRTIPFGKCVRDAVIYGTPRLRAIFSANGLDDFVQDFQSNPPPGNQVVYFIYRIPDENQVRIDTRGISIELNSGDDPAIHFLHFCQNVNEDLLVLLNGGVLTNVLPNSLEREEGLSAAGGLPTGEFQFRMTGLNGQISLDFSIASNKTFDRSTRFFAGCIGTASNPKGFVVRNIKKDCDYQDVCSAGVANVNRINNNEYCDFSNGDSGVCQFCDTVGRGQDCDIAPRTTLPETTLPSPTTTLPETTLPQPTSTLPETTLPQPTSTLPETTLPDGTTTMLETTIGAFSEAQYDCSRRCLGIELITAAEEDAAGDGDSSSIAGILGGLFAVIILATVVYFLYKKYGDDFMRKDKPYMQSGPSLEIDNRSNYTRANQNYGEFDIDPEVPIAPTSTPVRETPQIPGGAPMLPPNASGGTPRITPAAPGIPPRPTPNTTAPPSPPEGPAVPPNRDAMPLRPPRRPDSDRSPSPVRGGVPSPFVIAANASPTPDRDVKFAFDQPERQSPAPLPPAQQRAPAPALPSNNAPSRGTPLFQVPDEGPARRSPPTGPPAAPVARGGPPRPPPQFQTSPEGFKRTVPDLAPSPMRPPPRAPNQAPPAPPPNLNSTNPVSGFKAVKEFVPSHQYAEQVEVEYETPVVEDPMLDDFKSYDSNYLESEFDKYQSESVSQMGRFQSSSVSASMQQYEYRPGMWQQQSNI